MKNIKTFIITTGLFFNAVFSHGSAKNQSLAKNNQSRPMPKAKEAFRQEQNVTKNILDAIARGSAESINVALRANPQEIQNILNNSNNNILTTAMNHRTPNPGIIHTLAVAGFRDENGRTPLEISIANGDVNLSERLINAGEDPLSYSGDDDSNNLLYVAEIAQTLTDDMVEMLTRLAPALLYQENNQGLLPTIWSSGNRLRERTISLAPPERNIREALRSQTAQFYS